ncbi:hypothetical protein D3C77_526450 [compost metagenome]
MAAGPARHLHQLSKQTLGRAEVVREQHRIRIQHAHQAQPRKIMPLGHHLRADQDVDLARVHGGEQRFGTAFLARAVGINAQDARTRK